MKADRISHAAKSVRKDADRSYTAEHSSWIGSGQTAKAHQDAETVHLTHREREVLSLLCEGLPNKLIARRLKIASGTVKVHISNIFRALNVSNRLHALVVARRWHLVAEPPADAQHERPHHRASHR
jgi:two-component system nitrate/nitrite response regulator NarL